MVGALVSSEATTFAAAQGHAPSHAPLLAIPTSLLERPPVRQLGIGSAHERVTTSSREAQEWYDTGLAHLYSFAWIDAAQAFNAALRLDARLAMAHLGLSFAYGGLGSLDGARTAAARAESLAAAASARDRLRIALRLEQLRVLSGTLPADRYAGTLDRALAAAPQDVELLLLRGEAASAPAGGGGGRDSDAASIRFFERARQAAPDAFAPRHYLAHAYENSNQVTLALRESEVYVKMAPAVPHAHHMLAHSLRRVGRTSEAIAEFERAAMLATAGARGDRMQLDADWHTHHNTALLASAYRYVGRWRDAARLLAAAFQQSAPLLPEELAKRQWPEFLLARGRPAEALAAAQALTSHAHPMVRAGGHLSGAMAHLAARRPARAAEAADAALRELRQAGPDAAVLAPDLRLVQGVFLLHSGERERGRGMVRDAVASWRARPGPDAWSETLFAIEAALHLVRTAEDPALAAELTESLRQHDALYAGTSLALAQAADARGDRAAARAAYDAAIAGWRDADDDHAGLQSARARAAALRTPGR